MTIVVDAQTRVRRSPGVEASRFGGEYVLLEPSGKTLRGLNASAGRVWELLDGERTAAQVAHQLACEAQAPEAQVGPDVVALLSQLLERRLVEACPQMAAGPSRNSEQGVPR